MSMMDPPEIQNSCVMGTRDDERVLTGRKFRAPYSEKQFFFFCAVFLHHHWASFVILISLLTRHRRGVTANCLHGNPGIYT